MRCLMLLVCLCGCAAQDAGSVAPAIYPDPRCAKVARERASDAVVNGYDDAMAARVGRDTYASCVSENTRMER